MIIEIRNKIKSMLEEAYQAQNLNPYINITGFPDGKEALDNIQKNAKMYDSGAIFITWTAERPGEKISEIYRDFVDVFTLFIFSNSKFDDSEVIKLYQIARNVLSTKFYLYHGEMSPVRTDKTGLFMAVLQIGISNIYQNINHVIFKGETKK